MTAASCGECGSVNLPDSLFCATCGVALSGDHVDHPDLAALVGLADPTADDPIDVNPIRDVTTLAGDDPTGDHPVPDAPLPGDPAPDVLPGTAPIAAMPIGVGAGDLLVTPHRRRDRITATVVAAAVLAVAALAALIILGVRGERNDDGAASPNSTAVPTVTATSNPTEAAIADPATAETGSPDAGTVDAPDTADAGGANAVPETDDDTDTAPVVDDADGTDGPVELEDSRSQLTDLAAADLARATELRERWVPQLSGKRDGTEWEGVTYDHAAILELHLELHDQVGGALLVEGSTLAFMLDGERMAGWWFTLADVEFDEPDDALDWCADAGFDRANCAARLVTDRDDATGTLRLRSA